MPTYRYRCADCGHQFDAVQRFADDPLRECPSCGGAIRRVIQPVGVVFKGSGWYINDSRQGQDDGKKATKADQADKTGADKPGGDKADGEKPTGDKAGGEKQPVAAEKAAVGEKAAAPAGAAAKPAAD